VKAVMYPPVSMPAKTAVSGTTDPSTSDSSSGRP
jgi:hypothetical protein